MRIEKDKDKPGRYYGTFESAELNILLNWARAADWGNCPRPHCTGCQYIGAMRKELERIVEAIDNNTDERLLMLEKFNDLNSNHFLQ